MKAIWLMGSLAAVGFVVVQQWDYHAWITQSGQSRATSRSVPMEEVWESGSGPITIGTKVYPESELMGLYSKVRDFYVMQGGVCYHRWQNPQAPAIAYEEFVNQFKNGYAFVELSEPGPGDTVVLEHRDIKRHIRKKDQGGVRVQ